MTLQVESVIHHPHNLNAYTKAHYYQRFTNHGSNHLNFDLHIQNSSTDDRMNHEETLPVKLFNVLEFIRLHHDPDLATIISWEPHGKGFRVHDPKKAEDKILPRFFNVRRYASFHPISGASRVLLLGRNNEEVVIISSKKITRTTTPAAEMMVHFTTITRCFNAARLSYAKVFVVAFAFYPSISPVQSSANSPSITQGKEGRLKMTNNK